MDWNNILKVVNVVVIAANVGFFIMRYFSERKRKFEDDLFDRKLNAYQGILERIHDISQKLDYSNEPFDSIHKYGSEEEWQPFFEKEVFPLVYLGLDLEISVTRDYGLLLPSHILSIIDEYSMLATRMVIETSYFDAEVILDKQDRMRDTRLDLLDAMREDLGVDRIDASLRKRIKEPKM